MDLATEATVVSGGVWLSSKAGPLLSLWQKEIAVHL